MYIFQMLWKRNRRVGQFVSYDYVYLKLEIHCAAWRCLGGFNQIVSFDFVKIEGQGQRQPILDKDFCVCSNSHE